MKENLLVAVRFKQRDDLTMKMRPGLWLVDVQKPISVLTCDKKKQGNSRKKHVTNLCGYKW